ncbi:MAG: hypothetical protein GX428_05755 [Candidatus Atribacteria bacterium]|nr:hypothetical protein [Candidatus Atribacteria bacterium]
MYSIFAYENQPELWVEAARNIEKRYGIDKALGYVIGEKLYNLLLMHNTSLIKLQKIEEQRKRSDYESHRKVQSVFGDYEIDLDQEYQRLKRVVDETNQAKQEMVKRILAAFDLSQIDDYFHSNPRLGSSGHILSEEQQRYWWKMGIEEHTLEDEIRDALLFGELQRLFFKET